MDDRGHENDALLADAMVGLQCAKFWSSEVGRYVLGRAGKEINGLLVDLEEADPEDPKRQREIRFDIGVRRKMIEYLDEQIQIGLLAQQQIEEEDADD